MSTATSPSAWRARQPNDPHRARRSIGRDALDSRTQHRLWLWLGAEPARDLRRRNLLGRRGTRRAGDPVHLAAFLTDNGKGATSIDVELDHRSSANDLSVAVTKLLRQADSEFEQMKVLCNRGCIILGNRRAGDVPRLPVARAHAPPADGKTYGLIVDDWGVPDALREALAIFSPQDVERGPRLGGVGLLSARPEPTPSADRGRRETYRNLRPCPDHPA